MRKEKPENQYDIAYPFQTWRGEPLHFVYQEDIELPNRGYVADRILAFRGDEWVGYLQIDLLRPDRFQELVPHFFNYLALFSGLSVLPEELEHTHPKDMSSSELHRAADRLCSYITGWNSTIQNTVTDYQSFEDWLSERERHSAILKSERQHMAKLKDFALNKPFVGMVNVADENRSLNFKGGFEGQGIARALYLAAACECAKRGRELHASSLIRERAIAVWLRMEQEGFVLRDGERMKLDAGKIAAAYNLDLDDEAELQRSHPFGL